jgi:hypothetical protein
MPKRRWFQFSLRSFLLVLTVFGVLLGLHVRSAKRQKEAVAAIKAYGGEVCYDFQKFDPRRNPHFDAKAESWVPKWLLANLGEDFFHDVVAVTLVIDDTGGRLNNPKVREDRFLPLNAFPDLRALYLHLHSTQAMNEGMRVIGGLKNLEILMMGEALGVSDAGTVYFENLQKLKCIHLLNAQITDESMRTFSRLPCLEELILQGDRFTDEGLKYLQGMTHLTYLRLSLAGGDITDEGMTYLQDQTGLVGLDLQKTRVTAKGLEQLKGLKNLNVNLEVRGY